MIDSIRKRILEALLLAIRPIARSLLRAGVGYREFSEVAKVAFVQIASEEYGLRGRPTNMSRVSVITGISRKEVGKIRMQDDLELDQIRGTPAGELLHIWFTDRRYIDSANLPLQLPIDSAGPSLATLVADVAGDIPLGAMKTELLRVGAIRLVEGDFVELVKRYYVPERVDEKLLHGFDTAIHFLADTISYNCDIERQGPVRFERVVSILGIDQESFTEIREETERRLTAVTESYDDYLSEIEVKSKKSDVESEVGIGLYYFQKVVPEYKK